MLNSSAKRLTALLPVLRSCNYDDLPRYSEVREAAQDGTIPAFQINNIWHYRSGDELMIAEKLGAIPARNAAAEAA